MGGGVGREVSTPCKGMGKACEKINTLPASGTGRVPAEDGLIRAAAAAAAASEEGWGWGWGWGWGDDVMYCTSSTVQSPHHPRDWSMVPFSRRSIVHKSK